MLSAGTKVGPGDGRGLDIGGRALGSLGRRRRGLGGGLGGRLRGGRGNTTADVAGTAGGRVAVPVRRRVVEALADGDELEAEALGGVNHPLGEAVNSKVLDIVGEREPGGVGGGARVDSALEAGLGVDTAILPVLGVEIVVDLHAS